jgi:hypothetical protein
MSCARRLPIEHDWKRGQAKEEVSKPSRLTLLKSCSFSTPSAPLELERSPLTLSMGLFPEARSAIGRECSSKIEHENDNDCFVLVTRFPITKAETDEFRVPRKAKGELSRESLRRQADTLHDPGLGLGVEVASGVGVGVWFSPGEGEAVGDGEGRRVGEGVATGSEGVSVTGPGDGEGNSAGEGAASGSRGAAAAGLGDGETLARISSRRFKICSTFQAGTR